jgi:hypothetical protein
MIIE